MLNKLKILGVRSGQIGDSIMAIPILSYLKKKLPNSYITWVIAKKFSQSAPLYINHPLIDKIYICDGENDNLSQEDMLNFMDYDMFINLTPQHPNGDSWYGKFSCVHETVRMSYGSWASSYFDLDSPDELLKDFEEVLSESERKPRLYKWWKESAVFKNNATKNKVIGIWPCAGYNQGGLARNPSQKFYNQLIRELKKLNYLIIIFGHPNDFPLNHGINYHHKSFFDQIQLSLETDLIIGTDSGSSWVFGAYGHPQISLIRDGYPNGRPDFWPLAPENYLGRNKNLTSCGGWDNVSIENVLEAVKLQLNI